MELVFEISENLLSFCSRTVNSSGGAGGGGGGGDTEPDLQTAFTHKWPDSDYIKHTSPALESRDKFLTHVSEVLPLSSAAESEADAPQWSDKSELKRKSELLAACYDVHSLFVRAIMKLVRDLKSNVVSLDVLILKEMHSAQGVMWYMQELAQVYSDAGECAQGVMWYMQELAQVYSDAGECAQGVM